MATPKVWAKIQPLESPVNLLDITTEQLAVSMQEKYISFVTKLLSFLNNFLYTDFKTYKFVCNLYYKNFYCWKTKLIRLQNKVHITILWPSLLCILFKAFIVFTVRIKTLKHLMKYVIFLCLIISIYI